MAKEISAKRIVALLCALTFCLSLVLSGCQFGSEEETTTTTTTTTTAQNVFDYIDPTQAQSDVTCPACGSVNVDEATNVNQQYDEHYICYDCDCEWYVEDGTAYQIAEEGKTVVITPTKRPVYQNNYSSNVNNRPVNSTKKSTTTTTTKKGPSITTDDVKELGKFLATGEWLKYIKWYVDEEGNITTEGDKGVLGFAYSTQDKCFYAAGNAWQRNFGYNELYDKTSQLIAISYDTINIYFPYDNRNWMIQLWKGQYGMVLLGAEVGVYNRDASITGSTHFNCASDEDKLPISLTLYQDGKTAPLFDRAAKSEWWMTGFVPGQLGVGVMVGSSETKKLSVTTGITFKDAQMTKAFELALKKVSRIYNNVDAMNPDDTSKGYRSYSFIKGDGTTPGTYSVSGNTITLTWK